MAGSPTTRTLKQLRDNDYKAWIVEKWNPHARQRQDMFGFIDILAIKDGETLAVQTTSYSNVSARVKKIEDSEYLPAVRDAGWRIEVHGWRKVKGKWVCRVVDVS